MDYYTDKVTVKDGGWYYPTYISKMLVFYYVLHLKESNFITENTFRIENKSIIFILVTYKHDQTLKIWMTVKWIMASRELMREIDNRYIARCIFDRIKKHNILLFY